MNKKGFTLIELIITIGVMVLVGLVIVTNMTGLFSKNEDQDYENFRKKIENAACIYAEKDPNTGNYVKDNSKYDVTVSWASDGEKKCTLKE